MRVATESEMDSSRLTPLQMQQQQLQMLHAARNNGGVTAPSTPGGSADNALSEKEKKAKFKEINRLNAQIKEIQVKARDSVSSC